MYVRVVLGGMKGCSDRVLGTVIVVAFGAIALEGTFGVMYWV